MLNNSGEANGKKPAGPLYTWMLSAGTPGGYRLAPSNPGHP
jgi:hypothetical protein